MAKGYKLVVIGLLIVLPVLLGAWQAQAVTYKSTYSGATYRPTPIVNHQVVFPMVSFQSTSMYSSQWQEQTSMLNADGSVNAEVYMNGTNSAICPRRIINPDDDDDDNQENGTPIGDALLPLLLFGMVYIFLSRKKLKQTYRVCNGIIGVFVALTSIMMISCQPQGEQVRYSQEMINARMTAWHNKDAEAGFPNANSTNGITEPEHFATWDYVPGVVAKGILDVWEYYQDSTWADAWYIGLSEWIERLAINELAISAGILDDFNCLKVLIGLYEGAKPGGKFENAEKAAYYMEQLHRGAQALAEHKERFSIRELGDSEERIVVDGGWMHKATDNLRESYWGQMWCDGAYMGPALLAQLIRVGATEGTGLGWNDVYTQFEASWPYLWDEEKKLLYHVLFTDVEVNANARVIYENGHAYACKADGGVYHSEEYWGRAAGWYILALVDVLEAYMANLLPGEEPGANFDILHEYLTELADGLVARQDPNTGCWYQLLAYDSTKCATQGIDDTGSARYSNVGAGGTQCNYLESSASCLITAALLKGSRLGFIDQMDAGKRGYEGILKQFMRGEKGDYNLISSCQSAGLSKDRNGTAAYYLIGKDVPIQDNTEGKVLGAFLMAAVEYERLAD